MRLLLILLCSILRTCWSQESTFSPDVTTSTTTTENRDSKGNRIKGDLLKWLVGNIEDRHVEYEGYDGWYNNPAEPSLGSADSPMIRILKPAYSDGSYQPASRQANPLKVSEMVMKGKSGNMSKTGKTALLVFFGQQVVEEILDAQRPGCPPEYFNIKIPEEHEYKQYLKHSELPFLRSRYDTRTGNSPNNPRQQINEITPWIDGGLMYGTSKAWSDTLRSFKDGLMASSNNSLYPEENTIRIPMANPPPPIFHPNLKPVNRFFKLGNPRGNENPFLLTFGILWFRWHNAIARELRNHPTARNWTDERLFNEARKWVIGTYQHLVIDEWLPRWLEDSLPEYTGYDPSINPGISHVFQSAAMRFGHTLVVSGVYPRLLGERCERVNNSIGSPGHRLIRTCNSYWNPRVHVESYGLEGMLLGMATQPAEREDNVIVEDLRGRVFGPLEFNRRDLMAINIQRGRDHGLPGYRAAREYFFPENPSAATFEEMERLGGDVTNRDEMYSRILPELYNRTDDVDIWVGGLLETKTSPGQLFKAIIRDQFRRIRDGDRFWFNNTKNGLFTEEEINRIKQLTVYDVILAVTDITDKDIQPDPFRLPTEENIDQLHPACEMNMEPYDCEIEKGSRRQCFSFPPVRGSEENCTTPRTFDYFGGSEVSFALTFLSLFLFIVGCFLVLLFLVKRRQRQIRQQRRELNIHRRQTLDANSTVAVEWINQKEGTRPVTVRFNPVKKSLTIHQLNGKMIRFIDVRPLETVELQVSANGKRDYLLIRMARECDLVLKFDTPEERDDFIQGMEHFLGQMGLGRQRREMDFREMLNSAVTKEVRQKQLEKFFRVVFAQAFGIDHDRKELLNLDAEQAAEIINTELTPYEFAESLSLRSDALFVQQMFTLVDKDRNGYINFREFLDMIVLFAKGSAEEKAKLMFDMYDFDQSGKLTKKEFASMIRSMVELANQTLSEESLDLLVNNIFTNAQLGGKEELTFEDFKNLMSDHTNELGYVYLGFNVAGVTLNDMPGMNDTTRQSAFNRARDTVVRAYSYIDDRPSGVSELKQTQVKVQTKRDVPVKNKTKKRVINIRSFVENYHLQLFWIIIYTLVVIGIFIERAYYYSVEREHGGLRRIAGYGVTVTRGAASCMMFTYSTMLLTMCRTTITFLRETFLYQFIPFDDSLALHKYIAYWALFFTVIHSVGHALNFYHISTQTAPDLACLFRDFFRATDVLPKFHYWCFGTITGLTGVFLVLLMSVIYVFAIPYSRRYVSYAFWATHNLYPIFYLLMVLHGLGRLVQDPIFYYFFLGPCILYTLDKLVSVSRKKKEISVIRAEMLPSGVTMLELKKAPNFEYRSGQWVRIACPRLNDNEYHPFTLSSAPHEETLTVHIRAVGPWTTNIRRLFDPDTILRHAYPKIYLDGPYGEGHQDWFRYDVSVLIGGGIGVTPFSSILKDLVFKTSLRMKMTCKKVYFIWVTRTQKHFEWMTDIIQQIENNDTQNLVVVHIFITQFYKKFDLRTTMLYICERHFQRVSNRSLFTGLRSTTHFGRPDFNSFLDSLQYEHPGVEKFGIFSCGPPPMTRNVQRACDWLNKHDGPVYAHHYENF